MNYIAKRRIDGDYRVRLFVPALIAVGDHGETPQMAREHSLRISDKELNLVI